MSHWREEVPTSGSVTLPPDPHAFDGLGRNHSIETAIADLVDNSIDAAASEVLIRLVRQGGRLRSMYIVDNGHGMGEQDIDVAMTVGGQRDYGQSSLGKFGLGMKAASFSQARSLTALSRSVDGPAVGRRWRLQERRDFRCDIVPGEFAEEEFGRDWPIKMSGTGTIIRWDEVSGFTATTDPARIERFITASISKIVTHLGLVLHRFIASAQVRILVDVEDIDHDMAGPPFEVVALDPFGYHKTGHPGYPKTFVSDVDGHRVELVCHVWPGRSRLMEFRLPGGVMERQGLYFYRHGRLLHAGGWDGITIPDARLQLARVVVDIDDDIIGLFRMNPEKSKVGVGPEFARVVDMARAADGSGIAEYLSEAEAVYRKSRQRNHDRRKMIPPGKGFEPTVRRVIAEEIPLLDRENPIDLKWTRLESMDFFHVDRPARTLWLNDRYRKALLGGSKSGLNDAPMIKTLLYLLVEDVFQGEYLGTKDKDNVALWQELLTAAARSEVGRTQSQ